MQERFFNYKLLYIFKAFFVFALFFLKETLSFWRKLERARAKRPSTSGVTIESFSRTVKKISKRFYRFLNTTLQNDRGGRFYRFLNTTLQNNKVSVIVRRECDTAILRTISSILSITNFIKKKVWTSEVLQRPQMSFLTISLFLLTFLFLLPIQSQAVYPVARQRKLLITGIFLPLFLFLGIVFSSPAYGATPVYYSVGQNADDHKTGTPTITISGGTATFSTAQTASNMGVGDRVTYGTASTTAYIASKISTTQWNLITATGTVVADLAVATSVGSIIHEYTSLSAAEAGASDANHIGTSSLIYADIQLNFPLYYDSEADTNAVIVDGWDTSSTTYIKIYTPDDTATEVNQSQRHSGRWDDGRYNIVISNGTPITLQDRFIDIIGLQLKVSSTNANSQMGLKIEYSTGTEGKINIDSTIIAGNSTNTYSYHRGISLWNYGTGAGLTVSNSIFYGFKGGTRPAGFLSGRSDGGNFPAYSYNNTFYDLDFCVYDYSGSTMTAINNIAQNCTDGFYGTFDSSSDYNISSDATVPGSNSITNTTVQFVDATNNDLRLAETDTVARNAGTSTPTTYNPQTTTYLDIQGTPRGASWDIGADEVPVDFVSTICENTSAGGDCANMDYSTLSSWENAVEVDLVATTTIVYGGSVTGDLAENDVLDVYVSGADTGVNVVVVATSSDQILVDGITGTSTYLTLASGTQFRLSGGTTNMWTVTGTGDNLGASARAVAKIDGNWSSADGRVDIIGWNTDIDNSIKIYTTNSARHDGKWSNSVYRIEYAQTSSYTNTVSVDESFVRIDGIQISVDSNGYSDIRAIYVSSGANISPESNVIISNNIFKAIVDTYAYGLLFNNQNISGEIYNNLLYNFGGGSSNSNTIYTYNAKSFYIYNNTIYNSDYGIRRDSGVVVAKNNIVANTTNSYSGTFASGTDYNATDSSDDIGTGSNNRINQTFTFIDSANNDFHLAETDTGAKGAGTNLYSDQYINITNDIDGSARPSATSALTWDIGADQTARAIYRSVGPSNTTSLADYATEGTLTISSTTATFASALPDNVGVGDVIQYDTDNSGGVDTLAFIHARASSTEYTIRTVAGEYVTVASTSIATWEIYRAYTSLYNAEEGTENTGLDNTLENFETWTDGTDLVTPNYQWNVAAYGDAVDTTGVSINGWATGQQNYIKIFTPVSSTEVGVSQRHNGVAGTGFILRPLSSSAISFNDRNIRLDGVNIDLTDSNSWGVNSASGEDNVEHYVSNSIIHGITVDWRRLIELGSAGINSKAYVYNNYLYDNTGSEGAALRSGTNWTAYIYNNTVFNTERAFWQNGGVSIAKNNIAQNNTDGYYGTFDSSSDNNISDIAGDAPNATFSTAALNVRFADELNNDFHLSPLDRVAKNAGTSTLSWGLDPQAGGSNPLSRDIDGHTRNADGEGYDIGADEAANAVFYSVGQVATDHQTSTSTVSITNGLATFSVAQTSNVFGVGDRISFGTPTTTVYVSEKVDTSNWYVVTATGTTPTNVTNELVGSIIHEYTSLSSAEAGATDSNHLNTTDLKTNNLQLNFPAYYDNGADTNEFDINGYTTAQPNYIKIYTPNNVNTEVNLSQRHQGKWDDSKFRLEKAVQWQDMIELSDEYVRLDGLQVYNTQLNDQPNGLTINLVGDSGEYVFSNNIIRFNPNSTSSYRAGIDIQNAGKDSLTRIYNNIIYDSYVGIDSSPFSAGANGIIYINNNTVVNADLYGLSIAYESGSSGASMYVRNNLVLNSANLDYDLYGTGNLSVYETSNNISSDSTAPGTNSITSSTVQFIDATNNDFRLSPDDTVARDAGTSSPSALTSEVPGTSEVSFDIQGTPRGASWDIGADEVPVDFVSTICENTSAGGDCTNLDYSTLSSWESAVESDLTTETTRVFGGSIAGTINAGNTLTLYENGTTTEVTATLVATTSDQILLENIQRTSEVFNDLARLQAFHTASGSMWVLNEGVNYWTVTGTGDNLGASPRAVAKIDGTWGSADTNDVTIDDWITDVDNSIRIYTTNTARHNGKWDEDKYRLVINPAYGRVFTNYEEFITIDGLQMEQQGSYGSDSSGLKNRVNNSDSTVNISNNIIKNTDNSGTSGVGINLISNTNTAKVRAWNNIVYGFYNGITADNFNDYSMIILHNNTVLKFDSTGIWLSSGFPPIESYVSSYNNIVQGTSTNYSLNPGGGTYVTAFANNISSDTTSPGVEFDNITVSFISTSTDDYHLSEDDIYARGAGTNLYTDQYINITDDIDSSARPSATSSLTWDIGADQTARTIYRSVGPSNTTALADYATEGTLTISSTTATFASALPDNVGVGDVIQYDTDNSGGVDTLAFIHARASSTEYTIRDKYGEYVTVASTSITTWEIFRAYTSLYNAEAGTENTGLDDTLENFDTWSGGTDLVTPNYQWNIAAYGDAVDTTEVTIDGWTTSAQDYIKIFTPVSSTEVGTSQRHNGVWDDNKYRIENTSDANPDYVIDNNENYIRIDGLQIYAKRVDYSRAAIQSNISDPGGNIYLSNNILKGLFTGNIGGTIGAMDIENNYTINSNYYIWNNIIYGWKNGSSEYEGISFLYPDNTYVYNNTIYDSYNCYSKGGSDDLLINNIAQNCTNGYDGTFNASSDNNISDIAGDAPNATFSTSSITVKFTDSLNNDFHLSPIDRTAKNTGTSTASLVSSWSASDRISVGQDIDGHTRNADGEGYDIGADEAANAVFYSVGQVATDHQTSTSTISITNGLATFSVAQTSSVFGVGDRISFGTPTTTVYVSEKLDTSNWYVVTATGTTPTNVTDELVGSIIHEYTSLSSAESGAVDSNHLNTTDLKTNNLQLNFPAYYDDGADTTGVDISGYTTAQPNYIKIYSPNNTNTEVNLSQGNTGVWDDGKYSIFKNNGIGVYVRDSNVYINSVQIRVGSTDYDYGIRDTAGISNVYVNNSIVNCNANIQSGVTGISLVYSNPVVTNNIVYNGCVSGIWTGGSDGGTYLFNNTVYGAETGFNTQYIDTIAKNNIAYNSSTNFSGAFNSSSSNNISSDSTAPGTNSVNNATIKFLDEKNDDFRLSPKDTVANDAGVDLSTSTTYAFTLDNVGHTRGTDGYWDIGASEAATEIFRSVGPGNTTALKTGTSTTLSISGSTATFSDSMPLRMGVGDVIQYDADNDGTVDTLAFVHGRTTDKIYTVKTATGTTPTATTADDNDWSVFRAYASLADAETGTENTGLDNSLEAFETYSGGKDIFSSNEQWNIVGYKDDLDSTGFYIDGWDTSPQNYIKIYTAVDEKQVGVSQRHSGVENTGYRLLIDNEIRFYENYIWMDGFEIYNNTTNDAGILNSTDGGKNGAILRVSNNILHGFTNALYIQGAPSIWKIWNNIIYDNSNYGISGQSTENIVYAYNNTISSSTRGFAFSAPSVNYLYNNIIQNTTQDNFSLNGTTYASNNISSDATAPGANSKNLTTVAFRDIANNDFRLDPFDTSARNAGVNLQHDPYLWFEYDIEGQARDGSWDIGADEVINVTIMPTAKTINYNATAGLDEGLVGYWTFDGPDIDWNTNTILDRSGNYNNGTASGSPKAVNGKLGQAFEFDGVDDYIDVPNISLSGSFTMSAWVKTDTSSDSFIIRSKTNNFYWLAQNGAGNFYNGTSWNTVPGITVNDNTWHHVLVTGDGTNIITYVDGVEDTNDLLSNPATTTGIHIASRVTNYLDGSLDEVRIYDRALSATDVGMLYRKGFAVMQSKEHIYHKKGLVGYWSFDGFDMDWASTTAEVLDRSEYANPGNLIGGYKAVRGKIGQGMKFNGVDSYVDLGIPPELEISGNISLSAWVKLDSDTSGIIFGKLDTFGAMSYSLNRNSDYDSFAWSISSDGFDSNGGRSSDNSFEINQWYFVTAVYDGSYIRIYINGIEDVTGQLPLAYSFGINTSGALLKIGYDNISGASNAFDGTIDEARIYNYALSASEIKSLYGSGKVLTSP